MLIRPEALGAQLERPFAPLWVVYGDELLALEAADAIRAAARRHGYDERDTLVALPGFKWDQVRGATANMSLFGGRKLVDLRIPSGKPGVDGANALKELAASPSPDTAVLISLPELNWQDEKAAWLVALIEAGIAVKAPTPTLEQMPAWLASRLKRQGQGADSETLRFLAEKTEGNLLAAHQEVLKLGLLYPARTLTAEEIRSAVLNVARYDIDGLREALLKRNLARFARTLDGLRQEGEALPLVLWAIAEEVRALDQVAEGLAQGQALPGLLRDARVFGLRQGPLGQAAAAIAPAALREALRRLALIDRMVKGVSKGNPWSELLRLVSTLCESRRA
jgi:DNA polymerase-3 subunit delta